MLSNEQVIRFCERTKLLSRRPSRLALIEAMRLDIDFGLFLKESMMAGMNFSSCEDFLSCYQAFSNGINGKRLS